MKCSFALAILVVCCAVWGDAASLPAQRRKHCSQPLDNSATWNDVVDVAKQAQGEDKIHTARMIPKMSEKTFKEPDSCCLNANILNYYLRNVLTDASAAKHHHSRLPVVKQALNKVQEDLMNNANCSVTKYDTHSYTRTFRENFVAAGNNSVIKAIGELDILFHYLYESCGQDRC